MNFFDFITREELDNLPEDNADAFVEMSRIAHRSLHERQSEMNLDGSQNDWELLKEARMAFMSVMAAAAKRYDVEGLKDYHLPSVRDYDHTDFFQFKHDLDHYVAQLSIAGATRRKADSVWLPPKTKDRLRQQVHGLRETIERSNIEDPRRSDLLRKLEAFEAELEKRRLSLVQVARIAIDIAIIPGALWATGDIAMKLVSNVLQTVAEAEQEEIAARALFEPEPVKALEPPSRQPSRRKNDFPLDDDIPF